MGQPMASHDPFSIHVPRIDPFTNRCAPWTTPSAEDSVSDVNKTISCSVYASFSPVVRDTANAPSAPMLNRENSYEAPPSSLSNADTTPYDAVRVPRSSKVTT